MKVFIGTRSLLFQTRTHREKMLTAIERSGNCHKDIHGSERLQQGLCRCCFYLFPQADESIEIETECSACKEKFLSKGSETDALCKTCADNFSLCRHCASDRELRVHRKSWPNLKD